MQATLVAVDHKGVGECVMLMVHGLPNRMGRRHKETRLGWKNGRRQETPVCSLSILSLHNTQLRSS